MEWKSLKKKNPLKGDHPRISREKFGEILPSGLGGDVVKRKLLADRRIDGHPMITKAHKNVIQYFLSAFATAASGSSIYSSIHFN